MTEKIQKTVATQSGEDDSSQSGCSMLEWKWKTSTTRVGFLRGHPETTLFVITPHPKLEGARMQGAFMPDSVEHDIWDLDSAERAAENYMTDWVKMFNNQVSNTEVSDGAGSNRES